MLRLLLALPVVALAARHSFISKMQSYAKLLSL
uniref:Uncharacterized protein n=1 Tax=Glossina pallidipes TaxID=7398 RepID=A0A1A9Z8F6_GLOPL